MQAVRTLAAAALAAAILIGSPLYAGASDPHKPAKTAKPAAAKDAHAAAPAKDAHGPAPAKDAHAAPKAAAAKPTAAKPAPGPANLEAVAQRIHESLTEATKSWPAKKPAAAPRAPVARVAARRVRLEWRPSVSWPSELQDASDAHTPAGERVPLSWGEVIR